ncbi:DUF21 domain-containing protein [Gordonia pseudamarae]|uniref:DUF21 domain-containing protein n=1 Tax=Gordonia pseudamarae TaxID=2831662 RepID=A0ABX6IM13_9ACTN|nr:MULTISPECIES: hemolysin family protein [Gordonia]MBD0023800.1 HlyC/CorC family transporter [Gordonia sp. (in: high G+C Gram-positive bacteria)]QHN28105.1 DUF21 domain-containing protein [Gordonia pseudamarae]QHN36967.1 DUF21 domain-containing protein [Gordonia pseudamarae]
MLTVLGILLGVLVVLAITALTGYFVAQEFAFMAVDRSRLAARAAAGDAAAKRTLSVTRRTSFMLSGAQLGITITGLLVGYVAEPLIGNGVGDLFSDIGIPVSVGVAIGTVLAVGFSTVVQMVFGELLPKNLAIAKPEPVARWLARSTTIYLAVFGPIITVFDKAAELLLRILHIEPVHDVEHSATPRDLEHIVAESRETGELPAQLSTLLDRVLDFPTRSAEHAMIPRGNVDTVSVDDLARDVLELMSSGHTRYPVVDGAHEVRGIIDLQVLLNWSHAGADPTVTAGALCRPAIAVPDSLPLPEVLDQIEAADGELAIVIDEYGGFAGIITIEDIAEEIVGEIDDEHDPVTPKDVEQTDGGWLVQGDAHLDEVSRIIGYELPEGDYETIAGLVITIFEGLPDVGDTVTIPLDPDPADLIGEGGGHHEVRATVREIEKRVPSLVFVTFVGGTGKEAGDE